MSIRYCNLNEKIALLELIGTLQSQLKRAFEIGKKSQTTVNLHWKNFKTSIWCIEASIYKVACVKDKENNNAKSNIYSLQIYSLLI